ncbi:glycosyltransferase family [Grosmannia clavigera kw1407]|uniref:UDP-N-acetylglucosamine transferase subunit ALG13 n=1 Tax=Grosmannia clavigera (strain kw1407 / UAMH 11150) TaxID=655863 RepID=F0XSK8_GROCL|nr:glycosyltransferase family [Grosmannia clavigera kw1407]EFW99227.1 glycosyltransferase family [Grosmannia clavigera kw1407]
MSQQQEQGVEAYKTDNPFGRRCFVTVGATASFYRLLEEILSADFLDFLGAKGFAELLVQTGPDQDAVQTRMRQLTEERQQTSSRWPAVKTFSYTADIPSAMVPCRGRVGERRPGVVISHAGSGSILDTVRMDIPLVVVANGALLGNHQEELAEAVQTAGWAIKGELGRLQDAVERAVENADLDLLAGRFRQPEPDQFPIAESERSGLFDWAAVAASSCGLPAPEATLVQLD